MKKQAQQIAIATFCGFMDIEEGGTRDNSQASEENPPMLRGTFTPDGVALRVFHYLPEYSDSLDAMHLAEKRLKRKDPHAYMRFTCLLESVCGEANPISATAPQRAEAFLRCLNLWRE